jgi:hypothetical protein
MWIIGAFFSDTSWGRTRDTGEYATVAEAQTALDNLHPDDRESYTEDDCFTHFAIVPARLPDLDV